MSSTLSRREEEDYILRRLEEVGRLVITSNTLLDIIPFATDKQREVAVEAMDNAKILTLSILCVLMGMGVPHVKYEDIDFSELCDWLEENGLQDS